MSEERIDDVAQAMLHGAFAGSLAGVFTAAADFGSTWLWLSWWTDRTSLGWRMVSLHMPICACVGTIVGLLIFWGRRRATPTVFLVAALSPWLIYLAYRLFQGGRMSELSWVPLRIAIASVALTVGVALLTRGLIQVARRRSTEDAHPRKTAAVPLLLLFFIVAKANQHLYPGHYGYLHALLSALSLAFAATAVVVLSAGRVSHFVRTRRKTVFVCCALSLAALIFNVATLRNNENVRVALLSPRAAIGRPTLLALSRWTTKKRQREALADTIAAAKRAREKREQANPGEESLRAPGSHILLITIDALRADHVGAYGYTRPVSPFIDSLADQSILFERAYAAAPHSSYSISSLLTSEYLHETVELGIELPEITLPIALEAAGYKTAGYYTDGIFHTEGTRLDTYARSAFGLKRHDHASRSADELTELILQDVNQLIDEGEPPSFIWAHYFDVHEPYENQTFGNSDLDRYDSEILKTDRAIKKLITTMDERLIRDVIVAITSDHGEEFKDHGGVYHGSTLYEEQVRVPLVLRVPDGKSTRVRTPISLVDLAPTLLRLVEQDVPTSMRGQDLLSFVGRPSSDNPPVFAAVSHEKMVVRWPYKLIADLRFGLFELYDLQADPHERQNLAGEQKPLLKELKGEIYAWLDNLNEQASEYELALQRARLRDRRAVKELASMIVDDAVPMNARLEACQLLGHLADPNATQSLNQALRSPNERLASEAAIALGRMYNSGGQKRLLEIIVDSDRDLAARAAVSLARLKDVRAVPALIDATKTATDKYEREEITRWLGRLRDRRAYPTLLKLLKDFDTRYLAVIALGHLGDPRAYNVLENLSKREKNATVRDSIARAMGLLGDRQGIATVLQMALSEPHLTNPGEALVRLNAIEERTIGGIDFTKPTAISTPNLGKCEQTNPLHHWDYLHRTRCRMASDSITLRVPTNKDASPMTVLFSARRIDSSERASVEVKIGDSAAIRLPVDGRWEEHRWVLKTPPTTSAKITLAVQPKEARVELDHLLLLPSGSDQN